MSSHASGTQAPIRAWLYRARHRDTPLPATQIVEQIAAEPKVRCTQPWRRGWHLIGRGDNMYYCIHATIDVPRDFDTLVITPPETLTETPVLHCDAKQGWHTDDG